MEENANNQLPVEDSIRESNDFIKNYIRFSQLQDAFVAHSAILKKFSDNDKLKIALRINRAKLAHVLYFLIMPPSEQLFNKILDIDSLSQDEKEKVFESYISKRSQKFIKIPVWYQDKGTGKGYHEDLCELLPESLQKSIMNDSLLIPKITKLLENESDDAFIEIPNISIPKEEYLEEFDKLIQKVSKMPHQRLVI